MFVAVVTPPSPIVTFDEVAKHLVEVPEEDRSYVEGLVAAATAWIDGPTGWLGRALGPQLLEWRPHLWPRGEACWPIPSLLEIESVSYVDLAGDTHTWPVPVPLWFEHMPAIRGRHGDIRILYWAGYGARSEDDPDVWVSAVPPPIKVAIMMLVAQWYDVREAAVLGRAPAAMPFAVDALLTPYRVFKL